MDEFDNITSNFDKEVPDTEEEDTESEEMYEGDEGDVLWNVVEDVWGKIHPGTILTGGITVIEYYDIEEGRKGLMIAHPDNSSTWSALGLLEATKQYMHTEGIVSALTGSDDDMDEDLD